MKLIYSKNHNMFLMSCNFSQSKIPSSVGMKYNRKSKLWYTNDIYVAYKLVDYADDELKAKFIKYFDKKMDKLKDTYSFDSDIKIPKPENEFDFYNYQKAGVEYMLKHDFTLLADEMGLGKTPSAIGRINLMEDFYKVVIICPNSVKYNWKNEWETWSIHKNKKVCVYNSTNLKMDGDVIIINYEVLNSNTNKKSEKFRDPSKGKYNSSLVFLNMMKQFKKIDYLIVDEAHRIKNSSANTTKNIMKLKKFVDKGAFLTGTPILDKPDDIWNILKFCGLTGKFEKTKINFQKKYCGASFNRRFRRMENDMSKVSNATLSELQIKLRENLMIRRLKRDVLPELPDKIRTIVPIDVPNAFKEQYMNSEISTFDVSSLFDDSSKSTDVNKDTPILKSLKPSLITELTTFRHEVGMAKVNSVVEFAKSILNQGEKIVIFAHHKNVIEAYEKKLESYGCVKVYGGTKDYERQEAKQKFQTDKTTNVFIGNFRSASEGITLTKSNNLIMAEFDWIPAIMLQAEDRIHRISQESVCNIYYLCANETLDLYILNTIVKKIKIIDKVTEKDNIM